MDSYGGNSARIESLDAYEEANTNIQELYKETDPHLPTSSTINL